MGRMLLWTETLAACLLLVALAAACSARLSRRWFRVAVAVLTALVPGLIGLWAAALAAVFITTTQAQAYNWVLWYAACWEAAFAAGAVLIVRAGLRRRAGVGWPRGRLLIATVATIVLSATTLWTAEQAARNMLSALGAAAGVRVLSLTPSRPPDLQNAALIYEQAFGLIGKDAEVPRFAPEGDNAPARAFLKGHEVALRLLRRAGTMPDCYFGPVLTTSDLDALMPLLEQMRQGAKLLLLDARAQATDGHCGPALQDIEAAFSLARHVGQDPVSIRALAAMAVEQLAHDALQDILGACRPTPADLAEAPVDQTFSYWRLYRRSVQMGAAFGLASLAETGEQTGGAFFLVTEVAGHRRMMETYEKAFDGPYYKARGDIERTAAQAAGGRWGVLPAVSAAAFTRGASSAAVAQATYELDNMALAATAYRIEHGAYPKEAADLVPEYMTLLPLDPFSGEPMVVMAEEGGVVLYSVGPDMVDDGGAPFDQTSRKGDITFRLTAQP